MSQSWYVEVLLRNREQIRSNIVTKTDVPFDIEEEVDLDDDVYNDLLVVEKTLKDLIVTCQLSAKELLVTRLILDHKTLFQIKQITSLDEETVSDAFDRVCNKIAMILGYEFTDNGYLEIFAKKYKLTEQQKEVARNFMNPKYKSTVKANE